MPSRQLEVFSYFTRHIHGERRHQRLQDRKARQKANKRKSFPLQEEQAARYWEDPRYASGSSSSAAPSHGGPDTDECILLTIEDSTAEWQFYGIVFQLAVCFYFSSRYMNSFQHEMM